MSAITEKEIKAAAEIGNAAYRFFLDNGFFPTIVQQLEPYL